MSVPRVKITEATRAPADVLDPSQPRNITLPGLAFVIVNVEFCPFTNLTVPVAFSPIVAQSRPRNPKPCTGLENVNCTLKVGVIDTQVLPFRM